MTPVLGHELSVQSFGKPKTLKGRCSNTMLEQRPSAARKRSFKNLLSMQELLHLPGHNVLMTTKESRELASATMQGWISGGAIAFVAIVLFAVLLFGKNDHTTMDEFRTFMIQRIGLAGGIYLVGAGLCALLPKEANVAGKFLGLLGAIFGLVVLIMLL